MGDCYLQVDSGEKGGTNGNKGSITFPIAAKAKSLIASDVNGGDLTSMDYPYVVTFLIKNLTDSEVQYIVYHEGIGDFYFTRAVR